MAYKEEIQRELTVATIAARDGNQGKCRVCVRRAVGVAVSAIQARSGVVYGKDSVEQLRWVAGDVSAPQAVREAADRLQSRIRSDFSSPSSDPLTDGRLVIAYLLDVLRED